MKFWLLTLTWNQALRLAMLKEEEEEEKEEEEEEETTAAAAAASLCRTQTTGCNK